MQHVCDSAALALLVSVALLTTSSVLTRSVQELSLAPHTWLRSGGEDLLLPSIHSVVGVCSALRAASRLPTIPPLDASPLCTCRCVCVCACVGVCVCVCAWPLAVSVFG